MQTRTTREQQLTELGFIPCGYGFSSENIYVSGFQIAHSIDPDWDNYMDNLREQMSKVKPKLNFSALTELDKMQMFEKSLGFITGPEITDPDLMKILETTLLSIHEARKKMMMELTAYKTFNAFSKSVN